MFVQRCAQAGWQTFSWRVKTGKPPHPPPPPLGRPYFYFISVFLVFLVITYMSLIIFGEKKKKKNCARANSRKRIRYLRPDEHCAPSTTLGWWRKCV